MANGYVPGSYGPPIERKSYSQLINEQVARISQNAQANMLRRSQQRELETQRLLDRQNALTGMQITGVSPEDALALGNFKNQINQNMDVYELDQLNADINTFTTDLLAAQAKYSMGTKGAENYTSKSGKTDLNGAAYVTSEEDLDALSNYWNSGMFESVDGASALTVSGEPGSLRLTGIPIDQNGNVIEGGPVSIGSHPLMMNAERLFEPPTMDPPTTDDVVRDLVLGGKMEGLFKGVDGETGQMSLYGDLGKTAFDQNNLLFRYRQQWLRDNPDKVDQIPRDPKEWTDEVWEIVDPGMTKEALLERFRKTAKEARDSAGIESDSRLSSATAVGPDGKPGFEKPMELFTGVTTAAGESLDGELLRVRIIGKGQTTDGENPETVYDYELYYKDENGVLRTVRVPVGDPAHNTASSIFNNLPISDKATIMRQAGIDPNAEKKNPAVTDEDAEDPAVDAEDPATTTTTTTATGGGPSTKSVTATNQAAEEQPAAVEEEEDRQATLKSEYDDLIRDARSAKVADFFGVGKPYSEFVRSIQNLPLSMQKRLIQDKLNEEASNYKRGSRPEVLKTMVDKLNEMGVEAETDEEVARVYTSIRKELSDINAELETTPRRIQGISGKITNPAYTSLVERREELMNTMNAYEPLFGVMDAQPERMQEVEDILPPTPTESPSQGLEAPDPTPSTTPSVETTLPPEVVEEPAVTEEPTKVTEKPGATLPYPDVKLPKEEEELKAAVKAGNADRSPGRAGVRARKKAAKVVANLAASLGHPFPEAVASQYAIETGWWPKTEINNLFGMKVGAKTSEQLRKLGIEFGTIVLPTLEEITPKKEAGFLARNPGAKFVRKDGENSIYAIDANFYSFPDIETGVRGYIAWTQFNMPQAYSEEVKNGLEYVQALKKAGYATDSTYVPKLNSVVSGNLGIEGGLQSVQRRDY